MFSREDSWLRRRFFDDGEKWSFFWKKKLVRNCKNRYFQFQIQFLVQCPQEEILHWLSLKDFVFSMLVTQKWRFFWKKKLVRNCKNRYFFEDIQSLVQCPQEEVLYWLSLEDFVFSMLVTEKWRFFWKKKLIRNCKNRYFFEARYSSFWCNVLKRRFYID